MKKMQKVVVVMVAVGFMAIGLAVAADREQMTITELRVGTSAVQVSGTDSTILEDLYAGTPDLDTIEVKTGSLTGMEIVHVPSLAATLFEDFFTITKSTNVLEGTTLLAPWKYSGDAGVVADFTVGAGACGLLKCLSGSTDNNEAYIQYGAAGTDAAFNVTSNGAKELWFETKVTGPAVGTEAGMFVGLAEAGASVANFLVDNTMVVDTNKSYMGFTVKAADACTNWLFQMNIADGTSARTLTNIVANSATRRLGFKFDGVRTVTAYADGTAISPTITINAVAFPNAVNMNPIIAIKTGTANYSPTGTVDYVFIKQTR